MQNLGFYLFNYDLDLREPGQAAPTVFNVGANGISDAP